MQKDSDIDPYDQVVSWFFEQSGFELLDTLSDAEYRAQLDTIDPLSSLVHKYVPEVSKEDRYFFMEFVLWALAENKKLSKYHLGDGLHFKDVYGSYISGL